jgi:hypothetical protein
MDAYCMKVHKLENKCSHSLKDPVSNSMNRSDLRMYRVAIHHVVWIDLDEEVLQARLMISMICPTVGASCQCFIR